MSRPPSVSRFFVIASVLVFFTLACSFSSKASPTTTVAAPTKRPSSTAEVLPVSTVFIPTRQPTATSESFTVDQITVDYVYTSEMITVINHLYGSVLNDFVVVTLKNDSDKDARVIVQSEIVGFTSEAIDTVDVAAGETAEVRQNPRMLTSAIDELNSQKPADFHIHVVYLDNGEEREILNQTNQILVYARRDFPWTIQGFDQNETYELLAAMVTPQDPAVEALIRKAADYHEDGIMTSGYYSDVENDEGGRVWSRLEALWNAEGELYHLTYISTWVSFAPGDVQRIRLPAEVLEQQSGNCIELALLFASAAEALDLESAIILIPGHAYAAVRTDQVNALYYFIETTLIGQTDFATAVNSGNSEYEDASPHIEAGEQSYGWVTIWSAREEGILPIPWN